jgi:hypothetical protein
MSVNENHYVILGIKMKYKEYSEKYNIEECDSIHDSYTNRRTQKKGDIVVVVDGMSAEYVIIGKLLAKSRESYEGIPTTIINKEVFEDAQLRNELIEKFGFKESEINLNIIVFTHYS